MMTINESDMTFGPFAKQDCFYLEKSAIYQQIQQDVKMAEFLLLRTKATGPSTVWVIEANDPSTVWVIEAKSSAPAPNNQERFDEYLDEIREKLTNALMLGVATCLHRHPNADLELPDSFKTLNLTAIHFKLVLVIKGFKDEWLVPLQEALSKKLRTTVKIWALSPNAVTVINDTMARKHGLIT